MIVRIEHIEATERAPSRAAGMPRSDATYTVSATIEVSGVSSMGEAILSIERRLQMDAHIHQWADIPPLTSQLCSCGAMRRNEK